MKSLELTNSQRTQLLNDAEGLYLEMNGCVRGAFYTDCFTEREAKQYMKKLGYGELMHDRKTEVYFDCSFVHVSARCQDLVMSDLEELQA